MFFLPLSFKRATYLLDMISLSDMWFSNMLSQSLACFLIHSMNSFAEQKGFNFVKPVFLNNF